MKLVFWIQSLTPQGGGVELLNPAVGVLNRLYGASDVLGVISPKGTGLNGVKSLSAADLNVLDYDYILLTGYKASPVPLIQAGIDEDKILIDRAVCTPFFTIEKYKKLRRSQLSILSMNCFAGLLYNRFGLPFLSPTVNMFTTDKDFLKFLKNPQKNVEAKLKLLRTARNDALKIDYPVFKIGDVEWEMNHYDDANFAKQKWKERGGRINWFNLLVTMYTENPEILAEFDELPYAKKICLVPFQSELDSAYYIDPVKYNVGKDFWRIVNGVATGAVVEFEIFDMLLYGKKTPLKVKTN